MKNLTKINLFIAITLIASIALYSCKKKTDTSMVVKGCMDSSSLNFNPNATQDDGSCTYPRDAFVGLWNISDTATRTSPVTTYYTTYILTIQKGSGTTGIKIINFNNQNDTLTATVNGTMASIPNQFAGFGSSGNTISGNMNLAGSGIYYYTTYIDHDTWNIHGAGTH